MTTLIVEVMTASGCIRCKRAKALAKKVIAELDDDRLLYREVNVIEELDYAVALGLLSTPAIVLNGEFVFSSLPSAVKLRQAIFERLG